MTRWFTWIAVVLAVIYSAALCALYVAADRIPQSAPDLKEVLAQRGCMAETTAIVVFYTGLAGERHARTREAFNLLKVGVAQFVIAVGGYRPKESQPYGSLKVVGMLEDMGVPREQLAFDKNSNDTVSNLDSARTLALNNNASCVVLVSHKLHLVRIGMLSKQRFADMAVFLHGHAEPETLRRYLYLLHYEMIAYATLMLPRSWVRTIVETLRQTFRDG